LFDDRTAGYPPKQTCFITLIHLVICIDITRNITDEMPVTERVIMLIKTHLVYYTKKCNNSQ
jgi:hypothetical protein